MNELHIKITEICYTPCSSECSAHATIMATLAAMTGQIWSTARVASVTVQWSLAMGSSLPLYSNKLIRTSGEQFAIEPLIN